MQRIYCDHTATTPLDRRVLEAMQPYLTEVHGNASSAHWYGRQARAALEDARARIATALGVSPGELFFTSGGTESDNLAIAGVYRTASRHGSRRIITEAAEHHAVLDACEALRDEGADVVIVPVDASGCVDPGHIERELTPQTALLSIMHANNEVGTVQPVEEIAALARRAGVPFHTDAVQTVGKIPVDVGALGADLLSFTGHKLYGPKGIGVLFARKGTAVAPLFHGGGQERGVRPGTENVALAVGCAVAVELAVAGVPSETNRLRSLRDTLEKELRSVYPSLLVNGALDRRLPHILSVSFDAASTPMEGEMLVTNMDLEGIAVSSGSACTSGSIQPSHVLTAMGRNQQTAKATLRFSFGKGNSEADIPQILRALDRILLRMGVGRQCP